LARIEISQTPISKIEREKHFIFVFVFSNSCDAQLGNLHALPFSLSTAVLTLRNFQLYRWTIKSKVKFLFPDEKTKGNARSGKEIISFDGVVGVAGTIFVIRSLLYLGSASAVIYSEGRTSCEAYF
jgi:hypothetical protein